MKESKIEWTDATWNPVRGCSRISPGCVNCYAERMAARFSKPGMWAEGLAKMTPSGPRWTGKLSLVEEKLEDPIRWKEPKRIFVNSTSDLFHELIEEWWIDEVFGVMAACSWHTFQVLTKRPERMQAYMADPTTMERVSAVMAGIIDEHVDPCNRKKGDMRATAPSLGFEGDGWPLKNVWLGTSVEDQGSAEARIPLLWQTPAAVRFLSCEPLLQRLELRRHLWNGDKALDWVIVGGESGPGARPCRANWVRAIVTHCSTAGIPVFVKQLGAHVIDQNDAGFDGHERDNWPDGTETDRWDLDPSRQYQGADARILLTHAKGGNMEEWPLDLRVREFPEVSA